MKITRFLVGAALAGALLSGASACSDNSNAVDAGSILPSDAGRPDGGTSGDAGEASDAGTGPDAAVTPP